MFQERFFTIDPVREFNRLQQELGRLLNRPAANLEGRTYPLVNVYQNDEKVIITTELPGFDPNDLNLSVQNDVLTIKGVRKPLELKEGERYHRRERLYGEFERAVRLPYRVDADKIEAHFRNGILTITLPRAEEDKPKKIKIVAQ
jgi:HSP20 family protein